MYLMMAFMLMHFLHTVIVCGGIGVGIILGVQVGHLVVGIHHGTLIGMETTGMVDIGVDIGDITIITTGIRIIMDHSMQV